jgi:choline-sulfatase
MKNQITRRDFLKLAGILPLSVSASRILDSLYKQQGQQNVIVIVFDALSAYHISLYGYQRETMPNLARLAERAIVYHNHYSGGNYTTPGTASLLTGTLPWTHRAFQHNGTVSETFAKKNIFSAFQNYYRFTYTHNLWAETLLKQFQSEVNNSIPRNSFFITGESFIPLLFNKDEDIASVSWIRTIKRKEEEYAYSLFLSRVYEPYWDMHWETKIADLKPLYPRDIPGDGTNYFLLEQAIDSTVDMFTSMPQPFLGYLHYWPPHAPYRTHRNLYGRFFDDALNPVPKPLHSLATGRNLAYARNRLEYDESILYVDQEFSRFFDSLEASGQLENTWIILTSDHGELFERGISGHNTPVLYEPLVRIPLIIFEPGRKTRRDIFEPTSAIDVLPTLLHITGQPQVAWTEGEILPPFGQSLDSDRSIYVLEASKNEKFSPFTTATVALIKGRYKLMYFFGYEQFEGMDSNRIELYDISNDPEELHNLYSTEKRITEELLNELKTKLTDVNVLYQ